MSVTGRRRVKKKGKEMNERFFLTANARTTAYVHLKLALVIAEMPASGDL